jgi:hypothetical protein
MINNIPRGQHWAILQDESVHIPGDERSRQAPGHGYPEHTETFISYRSFGDEAAFRVAMQEALSGRYPKHVRGIHVIETFGGKTVVQVEKD